MNAKHFVFRNSNESGRFAIAVDNEHLVVRQIAGRCPTLGQVVKAIAKWPELVEGMNALARMRPEAYVVQVRHGMSGATDYLLREYRDAVLADYPIRARLHVSMRGKINDGVRVWLGDFPALFHAAASSLAPGDPDETIEEVAVVTFDDDQFVEPGVELLRVEDGILTAARRENESFFCSGS